MGRSRARLVINGGGYRAEEIEVDGQRLEGATRSLVLRAGVNQVTSLELDLVLADGVDFAGNAVVIIPEATRKALMALGWTPPPEGQEQ